MYQSHPPRSPKDSLPTMYDLPSEDPNEPGVPDEFHTYQPRLLDETLHPPADFEEGIFSASDLNLYYDGRHPSWYKRPDWFMVLGVERAQRQQDLRWSYVIWQESLAPFLVVELLSPGTESQDLGETLRDASKPPPKWEVYERLLRVPYYVIFDRYTSTLRCFRLAGTQYEEQTLSEPQVWFAELRMHLAVWQGVYAGAEGLWLRWQDAAGNWLPTNLEETARSKEEAQQAQQEAQQAQQEAQQERDRADRLAQKLREMGLDPDAI